MNTLFKRLVSSLIALILVFPAPGYPIFCPNSSNFLPHVQNYCTTQAVVQPASWGRHLLYSFKTAFANIRQAAEARLEPEEKPLPPIFHPESVPLWTAMALFAALISKSGPTIFVPFVVLGVGILLYHNVRTMIQSKRTAAIETRTASAAIAHSNRKILRTIIYRLIEDYVKNERVSIFESDPTKDFHVTLKKGMVIYTSEMSEITELEKNLKEYRQRRGDSSVSFAQDEKEFLIFLGAKYGVFELYLTKALTLLNDPSLQPQSFWTPKQVSRLWNLQLHAEELAISDPFDLEQNRMILFNTQLLHEEVAAKAKPAPKDTVGISIPVLPFEEVDPIYELSTYRLAHSDTYDAWVVYQAFGHEGLTQWKKSTRDETKRQALYTRAIEKMNRDQGLDLIPGNIKGQLELLASQDPTEKLKWPSASLISVRLLFAPDYEQRHFWTHASGRAFAESHGQDEWTSERTRGAGLIVSATQRAAARALVFWGSLGVVFDLFSILLTRTGHLRAESVMASPAFLITLSLAFLLAGLLRAWVKGRRAGIAAHRDWNIKVFTGEIKGPVE